MAIFMKRFPKLRPGVWDALVAAAVLAAAVGCAAAVWGGRAEAETLTVVISADGQELRRCALAELPEEAQTIQSGGVTLRLERVETPQPGIRVAYSDCPTQDCVHTGTITRAGQSVVCLPARVVIQLEGGSDGGVDLVVG